MLQLIPCYSADVHRSFGTLHPDNRTSGRRVPASSVIATIKVVGQASFLGLLFVALLAVSASAQENNSSSQHPETSSLYRGSGR